MNTLLCPLWRALKWVHDWVGDLDDTEAMALLIALFILGIIEAMLWMTLGHWWMGPLFIIGCVLLMLIFIGLCEAISWLWSHFGTFLERRVRACDKAKSSSSSSELIS